MRLPDCESRITLPCDSSQEELTDLQPNTMYTAYLHPRSYQKLFNTLSVSFTTLSGEKIYREYPPVNTFGFISVIHERKEKGEGFNRNLNPIR